MAHGKFFHAVAAGAFGLVALGLITAPARAEVDRIVVFGTSLSDPGNAFILTGETTTAPYDTLDEFLVPDAPYARGGQHFSDGATWIEQYAKTRGLAHSVGPAFVGFPADATNYAIGGTRARTVSGKPALADQIDLFLADFQGVAPAGALYVIEIGINDVRDALILADPGVLTEALGEISEQVGALYAAGARKFLVANAPDLALTPAIQRLDQAFPGAGIAEAATALTQGFNAGLDAILDGLEATPDPDLEVTRLDVFGAVSDIVENPGDFGLTETGAPCINPDDHPFTCATPNAYVFWDGIHPTKAVHGLVADATAAALGD